MRHHSANIFSTIIFSLLGLENAVFYGYDPLIAFLSGLAGIPVGIVMGVWLTNRLEKMGEFRHGRKFFLALLIGMIVWIYLVIDLSLVRMVSPSSITSLYAFGPTAFAAELIICWQWETKNDEKIYIEGFWKTTFYAVPNSMTGEQHYKYRSQQNHELRKGTN